MAATLDGHFPDDSSLTRTITIFFGSLKGIVREVPLCMTPHLTYVDTVPQMLGADGKPRKELLVADGLHMTPAGYKIWNDALRPVLQRKDGGTK